MSGTVPSGALPAEHAVLLGDLRALIRDARQRVAQAANSALTMTYWRVGRRLLVEDLAEERGEYGRQILATLSQQLQAEFGRGFSYSSLTRMARSAEMFPDEGIVASLMQDLTWTHVLMLQLDAKSIRVAEYLTELPPPEILRDRLHRALAAARERAVLSGQQGGDA